MSCLDTEQILALVVQKDNSPALVHVGACPKCAARLAKVEEQLGRLETAMSWLDRDHPTERARLLAALSSVKSEMPRLSTQTWPQKVKEVLIMPRTWIGAAAAAVLIVVVLVVSSGPGTASLLADTAQALREIQSYRCRTTEKDTAADGKGETGVGKWYWAQPGSYRMENYEDGKLTWLQVLPKNKPGLEIDYRAKTYERLQPVKARPSPLMALTSLAKYAGQADRQLERRTIENIQSPGFEIDLAKVDPDLGTGKLRLWTDPKTKLPLRVEAVMNTVEMVFDKFEWNVNTDGWFNVEPPAGFKDKTPTPTSPGAKDITQHIIMGLKTYAKYCGGRYPQAKMVYGDVTSEELNRSVGLPPRSPPKDNALQEVYAECMKASLGFAWINELQRHDAGAVFHGKTVGPQDKNKVLFRWTLPDGRFRVIYGDLHFENVSAERLKKLESQ